MDSLKFSPVLNRMIRQDDNTRLGEPTRPLLEAAVQNASFEAATQWLDYYLQEQAAIRNIWGIWDWYMVRYYLDRKGDEAWPKLLQKSMAPWLGTTAGLKGQPGAQVRTDGHNAVLTVPGLPLDYHIIETSQFFNMTLDTPDAEAELSAQWRAEINACIQARDLPSFRRLLDVYLLQAILLHDIGADWAWALLTVIALEWGEAVLDEVLRVTEAPWVTARYDRLRQMSTSDALQLTIEGMRGHFSGPERAGTIDVTEEPDRYVLSFDACGTGGRMRRGDPLVGSGSRLEAPYNFLNVQGAYDWTWNRKGVCAYCAHCAVVNHILPIEGLGRPMRLTLYPENRDDPCRWIIYKDPNDFPTEAFTMVGKTPPQP